MERPQRKHPRLKTHDYSQCGAYFVTTNVYGGRCILSEIVVGRGIAPAEVQLTPVGEVVRRQIMDLPKRYPVVSVDKYVIMPNHVHLLLSFHEDAAGTSPRPTGQGDTAGESRHPTTEQEIQASPRPTLMQVVGAFKSLSARLSNRAMGTPGEKLWQDSFYESVLQGERAYQDAWNYIDTNPAKWAEDEYFAR